MEQRYPCKLLPFCCTLLNNSGADCRCDLHKTSDDFVVLLKVFVVVLFQRNETYLEAEFKGNVTFYCHNTHTSTGDTSSCTCCGAAQGSLQSPGRSMASAGWNPAAGGSWALGQTILWWLESFKTLRSKKCTFSDTFTLIFFPLYSNSVPLYVLQRCEMKCGC